MPKGTRASKGILRAVDMTEAEYKEIDPLGVAREAEEQIKGGKQQQRSPKKNTTATTAPPTFLASTRTKALEETPIPPKRASKGDKTGDGEEESQSSMEDLLCLNYGGGGPKAKSSGGVRTASPPSEAATDLSEYLSPSSPGGKPLYSRLLRDEIEAADRRLLEDARKAKQVGCSVI